VQVLDAGPYQSINIRGIGNTAITPAIVPGIAVTHDGLLSDETIFIGEPFFDIADVEVLRGPQGTLVGASSTGGAVEITSQDPNFRGLGGYAEAAVGNYADQHVDGAVNLPISDTFAARLAINWESRGSFYRNINTFLPGSTNATNDPGSMDAHNARIGLLWKPSESFQALLKISLNYQSTDGTAAEPNQYTFSSGPGQACPDGSPGPTCHSLYYKYSTHIPFLTNMNLPAQVGKAVADRYSLDMRWTFGNGVSFRSLTGFQHLDGGDMVQDDDFSSANASIHYKDVGPQDNYYSQEFTLQSAPTGPVTWIAGAMWFYRHTPVEDTSYSAFPFYVPTIPGDGLLPVGPLGTQTVLLNLAADQRTEGLFANVDWDLTKTLQLQAGVRGNWDQNFSDNGNNGWYPGAPPGAGIIVQLPIPVGAPCPGLPGTTCLYISNAATQTDSVPTGKIDLNWTPVPGQYFYAFWARGYKSGGVRPPGNNGFKPEIVDDFEAGWKTQLLDNHLTASVGGYWMRYHDMQLPTLNATTGANATTNIPATSTIRGIEINADGRFGGFGAILGATIDKSSLGSVTEYATYRLPPNLGNIPQCVAGTVQPTCFDYSPYAVNLSGLQNPYTPKFTASATLNYRFSLTGDTSLTPSVSYSYTGRQFDSIFQQDNYFLLTARHLLNVSATLMHGPWTAEAFCNNCANEVYVAGAGGVSQGDVWYYGSPRQFGLRVQRTF